MKQTKVSVLIVNFNSKEYLYKCLESLSIQTFKNFEVILVDNNSSDGSAEYIKDKFLKSKTFKLNIKLIEEKENHGFSGGNNIAYKHSYGDYIILLNNDTKVEPDYIENFVNVFIEFPKCGIAQSKILIYDSPETIQVAGSFWTKYAYLYHFGFYKPANQKKYNTSYKIFAALGASMILKREVIEKIGLFNNLFWHYYEDSDLCHRAINAGYDVMYYPKAVCYHKISVSRVSLKNEEKIHFNNNKNKLISYTLNFKFPEVIYVLIKFTFFNLLSVCMRFLTLNTSYIFGTLRSYLWFFKSLKTILRNRKKTKYKGTEKNLPSKETSIPYFLNPQNPKYD